MNDLLTRIPVSSNKHLGPLWQGRTVCQSFRAEDDSLYSIALFVATFFKKIKSNATLQVLNDEGESPIRTVKVNTQSFDDNSWQHFVFEPIADSKGRAFKFSFETDAVGDAITLWTNDEIPGAFFVDGQAFTGGVCFNTLYRTNLYHSRIAMVAAPEVERVSHLWPNDCYFAHLAVYRFASQFCRDATGLDAGSGMGYGAAYLADHGARKVIGIDVDNESIQFSMEHFNRHNVEYLSMDLGNLSGFDGQKFDLIFSSNTLEHVPKLERFFYSATILLKRSGRLIVAVPPIITQDDRDHNIANPYHLNIWSPFQWKHMLERYFDEVQAYRQDLTKIGYPLNFLNTPLETEIDETDFGFSPVALDDYVRNPSLTALFVARSPKSSEDGPTPRTPISFIDDSFSRGALPSQRSNWFGRLQRIFKLKFRFPSRRRQR